MPVIMGILNVTPDSFFPPSRVAVSTVVDRALAMVSDGAGIIDLGGESTRPGSDAVPEADEIARVVPAIRAIREHTGVPISIDTRKASVARAAIEAGATMVNDVSGLTFDRELAPLVAEAGTPVVLMHMRGVPQTMQKAPHYDDTIEEVTRELRERVEHAVANGVRRTQIILDPGIGFSKRLSDNLLLLRELDSLRLGEFPLLVGASRKSFIGMVLRDHAGTARPADDRLIGSITVAAWAALKGADIVRVHDVRETGDAFRMLAAIQSAQGEQD